MKETRANIRLSMSVNHTDRSTEHICRKKGLNDVKDSCWGGPGGALIVPPVRDATESWPYLCLQKGVSLFIELYIVKLYQVSTPGI